MRIKVQLREMAANEISRMIPPDVLYSIKQNDPHPIFKAFVIGHEGEAHGYVVGFGNVVKRWYRAAIEKLHEKIREGIQLFHGHGETNDQAGRQPIGKIVGKQLMKIGDRLSSVVACYIFPSFRNLPLDVASIEAGVRMEDDPRRPGLYVAEVDDVSAVALGNSAIEQPGFSGATLLGQLQAFAKSSLQGDNLMDLTLDDIRSYLRSEKVKPSDLFEMDALGSDPAVRGLAEDRVKERIAGVWREKKEAEEKYEKLQKEVGDREVELKKQITSLRVEAARSEVGRLFDKKKGERKLDDRQMKFIQSRIAKFTPADPDKLEAEFESYLDSEIDELGKIKSALGIEDAPGNGKNREKPAGAEPDDSPSPETDNPYLDPNKNSMIKIG